MFKPFNPSTPNHEIYKDENDEEGESMDMSFLNKVFAPDDLNSKSEIWSSPESPWDNESDKLSTTAKISLVEIKQKPSCQINFKGEYKNGKLTG